MRRHKLLCLENAGLVQETSECGYGYRSFSGSGVDDALPSGDPAEDEKLRTYMLVKARRDAVARARRVARLRKLARMDFKMVGGVAPIGFGGSGGADGFGRPVSGGARS